MEKIQVYVDKKKYQLARGILLTKDGKSFSAWVREQIEKLIGRKDANRCKDRRS